MIETLKKYSILYVEDDLAIQANIKEYLQSFFNIVYIASDGKFALEIYQKFYPDVLLLDINIPYIDGIKLAKQIRIHDKKVKIVILTGHTEKERLLQATELKLTKYLVKPVSPRHFKETMKVLAQELEESPSYLLSICKNCLWNKKEKQLYFNQKPILLLEKEQRLLELFLKKPNQCITYVDIMIALWEESFSKEISINSVKNQVSHLRKRLPKHLINSVYGEGYSFKL